MTKARNILMIFAALAILAGGFSCSQDINVGADTLKTPIFDNPTGTRFDDLNWDVTIQNPNGISSVMRYTLDNSEPTGTSTQYNLLNPPEISATTIVKAKAFQASYNPSATATATFYKVWTSKSALPTARRGSAVVSLNGRIYVIGGISGSSPTFTYYDTVEEYTPAQGTGNGTWVTKAPLGTARAYCAAAVYGGKIYIFGGNNAGYLDTVEEYTWADGVGGGSWSYMASMISPARTYISASEYNGKIYLIGGQQTGPVYLNRIDEYTPSGNTWLTKTAVLGTARKEHVTVSLNNRIFIIGGYNGAILNSVEIYDPTNDTINSSGPSIAISRCRFSGATNGNFIYIFGGNTTNYSTFTSSIEKYSITNGWQADSFSLSSGRAEMNATFLVTAYGDFMYLPGGRTSGNTEISILDEFVP